LSNGNYSNLKHMHTHNLTNTEPFVAMPSQPVVHSQYLSASSGGSHQLTSSGQLNTVSQPLPHQSNPDLLIGRSNIISGHNVSTTLPAQSHAQESHPISGNLGPNQYNQMNRNVNLLSSQHSQSHQLPHQHLGAIPVNPVHGGGHMYNSGQQPSHYSNHQAPQSTLQHIGQSTSSFPGRSSGPKNWHSADHSQLRDTVAEEIVKILKSRKPNANDNWHDKLPHMARRLEDALYFEAATLDEYADRNTLKQRLQQLALSMGNSKNAQTKPNPIPQQSQVPQLPTQQQNPAHHLMRSSNQPGAGFNNPQPLPFNSTQPHMQHLTQHSHQQLGQLPNSSYMNYQQQPPPPQQQQQQQHPTQQIRPPSSQFSQLNQQMHHTLPPGGMNSGMTLSQNIYHPAPIDYQQQMNPNLRNLTGTQMHSQPQQYHPENSQQNDGYQRAYPSTMTSNSLSGVQSSQPIGGFKPADEFTSHYGSHSQQLQRPNLSMMNPSTSGNLLSNPSHQPLGGLTQSMSSSNPNTDEHRKQVLKQQQQRLLLLRHASKCPHENGRCPVTPHCWNMKQLWKHIMSCKDQDCKVAHCVSSRYVLSHYSKCKEPTCPVCGPVREAIKRNYERSRDVVKMARNPNTIGGPVPQVNGVPSMTLNGVNPNLVPKVEEPEKKKQRKRNEQPVMPAAQAPPSQQLMIRQPPRKIYPLDPISSAIYSFTNEQIQAHFRTIHEGLRLTVSKIKEMAKPVVEELFRTPHAQNVFGTPVDPMALGLADYFEVVKVPMDLGTVMKKLDSGSYRDFQNFVSDVHLTFDNAMLYNPKNTDVYNLASSLKKEFDKKYKAKLSDFERSIEENRKNKEACLVCGEISLKYEPPVYYCNGPCAQRIRRNAVFYSNTANTYHWCSLCFNTVKESEIIKLPDCTITKAELAANKKKHIEESGEGWVECEGGCKRWIHQICSLFNNRRNVSDDVSYVCPVCLQEKRRRSPNEEIVAPTTKKMKAADLPVSTLSDFLEKRIYKRLELAYEESAQKLGIDMDSVEKCPPLTLRQVSCIDKLQPVREGFYNRYKDKGYPTDFPCRSKCLVLFQNIDGQDVILFGMYVYEYGHKCPQPNQRRVYISYLDSVHYLRPKQYRTLVYHEILISYLDYVKSRGFHTCHIWACPPQKGDDYILYVHPQDQKTPKPQILRVWYDEMLKRCMERGIVCEMTDLHTEYLADPMAEATSLPYFEGDYWMNEAEVIIKNFGDGKKDDDVYDENSGSKTKRRNKSKRPGKMLASVSTSGKSERDPLMQKLANIIEPMKDTFFVARLHPREYAEKFLQVDSDEKETEDENKEKTDKELQEEALSGQDIVPQLPDVPSNANSKGVKRQREDDDVSHNDNGEIGEEDSDDDFARDAAMITANSVLPNESKEAEIQNESPPVLEIKQENEFQQTVATSKAPGTADAMTKVASTPRTEAVPKTELASRSAPIQQKMIMSGEEMPNLPEDTEDVDDIQESEHFDTRQSFLNLCQGNHYQYDQLRRAKHSSMMVLYHLHNPDAPKFVPSCASCHQDILTGNRYRCEKCELDYCQSCLSRSGSMIHNHPLRTVNGSNSAPSKLTEEQRRERQRSIQLHMQLLNHAANCAKCESRNCAKMKVITPELHTFMLMLFFIGLSPT
jgi:E1A/CREB-binding protein